jgi:nitrite reductase/ring-hydroxylating ferredoxin subunit
MVDPRLLTTLDTLPDGAMVEIETLLGDDDAQSLIVRRSGSHVHAWLNVCPHAGRRLDWAPGQFLLSREGHLVCAVHGATFDLTSGTCVAGPCRGESLRKVDVVVREGGVWLETP